MKNMPFISVKNITYGYLQKRVINNINFSVNRGEVISLLGPNGSGKTTLLKMILGLYKPHTGQIFIEGREISVGSYYWITCFI